MDATTRSSLRPRIRAIAEPVVVRCGFELVAVELSTEGGQELVRLYIDAPGGVSVGDCTTVSHALSPVLDVDDPMPEQSYRLEVSSPGIDRPVESLRDIQRFRGFQARLRLLPRAGRRRFTGTLAGLEGDQLLLANGADIQRIPLADVDRIRLILDPDQYARLGAEGLPPVPDEASSPTPDPVE